MIKVVFDHIEGFGKITQLDFIYSDPKGINLKEDYLDYLEEGWVEWQNYWYNLRSTRILIKDYSPTKTTKKLSKRVNLTYTVLTSQQLKVLTPIYKKYVKVKEFTRDISLKDFEDFSAIFYWDQEELIGASIYKLYNQEGKSALVVYQFLWDYQDPKLSLGNVAQYFEIKLAQSKGCDYVYLMGGYEESCIYKSQFKGFQWWTGKEWSEDINLYQELCQRDTNVYIRT